MTKKYMVPVTVSIVVEAVSKEDALQRARELSSSISADSETQRDFLDSLDVIMPSSLEQVEELPEEEPITDGELLDLLFAELDKEQSVEKRGVAMAKLLTENRQG